MNARLRNRPSVSGFVPLVGLPAARRPGGERRVAHRVPCRVRILSDSGQWAVVGETVQLASDSLVVNIGRWIESGSTVEVLVPHLEGDPACLYGVVVGSRRAATGSFEVSIALTVEGPDGGFASGSGERD